MICKECKRNGLVSTVQPSGGTTTALYCSPFYGENGEYHHHDRNITSKNYVCSRGHVWSETSSSPCPNPNCNWGKE